MDSCVICSRHVPDDNGCTDNCRHRERVTGLLCGVCLQRIRDDLDVIAASWVTSALGSISCGNGGGGERPLPGGTAWVSWRHSGGTSGEMWASITGWARVWIEDFDLAQPERWDLLSVIGWLRHHLDIRGAGHLGIDEAASEWHEYACEGKRICGETEQGQIVRCPGVTDYCGRRLRVDVARPEEPIMCRGCGFTWTTARLLLRGTFADTEAWLDPEALTMLVGVDQSTLRRWARAGKVSRRNGVYLLSSVMEARAS